MEKLTSCSLVVQCLEQIQGRSMQVRQFQLQFRISYSRETRPKEPTQQRHRKHLGLGRRSRRMHNEIAAVGFEIRGE